MRPLPSKSPQEMFRSTKILGLVLVVGSVVALGAVCVKWPGAQTNTSVNSTVVLNTNAGTNSSISNANGNTNSGQNTNSSEIDTSDWLTYTNEEYGFSFRYPGDWTVHTIDQNDEGGLGLNIGSIVISSGYCRAQGELLNVGTIKKTKSFLLEDKNESLTELNRKGITGIRYYAVVNENKDKGYIYMYIIGQKEFSFGLIDNPTDKSCQSIFDEVMTTIFV